MQANKARAEEAERFFGVRIADMQSRMNSASQTGFFSSATNAVNEGAINQTAGSNPNP